MPKTSIYAALCLIFALFCSNTLADYPARHNFNSDWRFHLGDGDFKSPQYDSSSWRKLSLPHDWSAEGEFSKDNTGRNACLPAGIGWYIKKFSIPAEHEGRRVELQFDGIYRHSELWINGRSLGMQYDGYTTFYHDITDYVKFGQENTVAVRVDNSDQPNCRWYSGSGIYRNAWLTFRNPLHITNWGTYITTPQVSSENASVKIETTVKNDGEKQDFTLKTEIYSPEGEKIKEVSTEKTARFKQKLKINQQIEIDSPELWSTTAPHLYKAVSIVSAGGNTQSTRETRFGIRRLRFDAEEGFFLNGENMDFKGVCLHHEAGTLGAAVPKGVWQRRLENLRQIGCNAIRTAHNPPSPEFLDICDELGFLVMDEFVDKWENEKFADEHFRDEWRDNYLSTIKRDRNHPCVVIWSVGNENLPAGSKEQNGYLKMLGGFVRYHDPTRPVVSGMRRGGDYNVEKKVQNILKSCEYMDLIALNYGEQWADELAETNPDKPFVSTESYTYFNSSDKRRYAKIESAPWLDAARSDFNTGVFLWTGIDYLGESGWPKIGSSAGLFDIAGFRKTKSYLYEAFWSDNKSVYAAVYQQDPDDFSKIGQWGWPNLTESWNFEGKEKVDLAVYSNCEKTAIYVNDKKIEEKKLADFPNGIIKFRGVPYEKGVLRAEGIENGKEVCSYELKTTGEPAEIRLTAEDTPREDGICHIKAEVLDSQGRLVKNAGNEIEFSATGGGEVLSLSNGDLKCLRSFTETESWPAYKGRCLCIVRMEGGEPLKLKARSEGLNPGEIQVSSASSGEKD
ncbi:glycoside hydrolase family 2 TIM barrel-domain containing protein [Sedimentisphaera salicampi]|uniref:glycoside hydrolase family 2 TIM barrel-domain containing protein n=1 Tax=Sedimentisphaera salicampi TaxID=1941349 RepID=UPI000B9C18C9|nr:glycoside hydrolase family 2 TIM barrel-domain containing protein [Sedimentisphaera salicampi]OXU14552.1 Evolved beta-galactosidase subunit alpha [Sedimentisphaera salicampi]